MSFVRRLALILLLVPAWCGAQTVEYIHTDALGSPVAVTNSAGAVIERSEYEPYGEMTNRQADDRPGYTGHVMDSGTGLVYMQQRYYDPGIGRFLSVDPVIADSTLGTNFNRYWYANNNPYRFTDPDGRQSFGNNDGPVHSVAEVVDRVWGDIKGSLNTPAQAIAADSAYVIGVVTGDEGLQDAAIEGMRQNVTAQDGVSAVMMLASPRGAPGEGGAVRINPQKQAGHVPGTPQHANRVSQGKATSTFFGARSGEKATRIAHERGAPVPGRPNVKEYDFGRSVGTGPRGGMQTRVRVHEDQNGQIHGHPSGPERTK